MASGDVGMGARVERRIDAQAYRSARTQALRYLGDGVKFGQRLDVEHKNSRLQSGSNLLFGFANAGKNDFLRLSPSTQAALELAHRYDVETGAHRSKKPKHAEVGQRFSGKTDQMVYARKNLVKHLEMAAQSRRAVDVGRHARVGRDLLKGHLFRVKLALLVFEVMHCRTSFRTKIVLECKIQLYLLWLGRATWCAHKRARERRIAKLFSSTQSITSVSTIASSNQLAQAARCLTGNTSLRKKLALSECCSFRQRGSRAGKRFSRGDGSDRSGYGDFV